MIGYITFCLRGLGGLLSLEIISMSKQGEEFRKKQADMSDEELLGKCREELSKLCKTGGRSLTMCVPPQVDDTDMLFIELMRRYKLSIQKQVVDSQSVKGLTKKQVNQIANDGASAC